MRFGIINTPECKGPIVRTHVLNRSECNVESVGVVPFSGQLVYTNWHSWSSTKQGVSHVVFIQSRTLKNRCYATSVEADFDIYLTDGRVIEVQSCDRRVIEAAMKYAPVNDPRDKFRRSRGVIE